MFLFSYRRFLSQKHHLCEDKIQYIYHKQLSKLPPPGFALLFWLWVMHIFTQIYPLSYESVTANMRWRVREVIQVWSVLMNMKENHIPDRCNELWFTVTQVSSCCSVWTHFRLISDFKLPISINMSVNCCLRGSRTSVEGKLVEITDGWSHTLLLIQTHWNNLWPSRQQNTYYIPKLCSL